MAKKITQIKVFVSSPNDVREERVLIEDIFKELNLTNLSTYAINAELVKWETHVNPGISEYPQNVINKSIGNDYDIFMGILWHKFGTATKDYESGTLEEFNNAYNIYLKDPKSIKIMFYFKLTPIPINEIDYESIKKINEFKQELGKKGVLYWEYKSIEEFQKLIRLQLPRQIIEFVEELYNIPSQGVELNATEDSDEEDLGLLDFIEIGTKNFGDVNDIVGRMTNALDWINKRFLEKTNELNFHNKVNTPLSNSIKRHLIDSSAEDMDTFVARMSVEIPLFAEAYRKGLDNFSAALKIASKLETTTEDEMKSAIESLDIVIDTYSSVKIQCLDFRDMFISFPSITKSLNKAKRHCYQVLDDLVNELDASVNLTNVMKSEFNEYLKKY